MGSSSEDVVIKKPKKTSIKESFLSKYCKYINTGFKADIEAFLEDFKTLQSFNYADFAKIWQAKHFTLVFANMSYIRLLKIFCELAFGIVKKYIIFQTDLHTQIGAFYLLYGLFYKQPIQNFVKIRLTLPEYQKIVILMNEMSNRGQYDALYIFAKMKTSEVFEYVAHPRALGLVNPASICLENDDTFKTRTATSCLPLFEDLIKSKTFQDLESTCNDYEAKLADFCKNENGLTPFKSTIVNDIKEAYNNVFNTVTTSSATIVENPKVSDNKILKNRRSVRQKALEAKNAQYRGLKNVITGLDLDNNS